MVYTIVYIMAYAIGNITCSETTQHTLEELTNFLENDEWRFLFWDEARIILR